MSRSKQLRRLGWFALLLLFAIPLLVIVFIHENTANVMNPALDELSTVSIEKRWSHPQMLKIRALGAEAVPDLRRALREKNSPATRILLKFQNKWPRTTTNFFHLDPQRLTDRRWAACQAIQVLGPAAHAAAPEVIDIIGDKNIDLRDLNGAAGALFAIGIDAEACDRLNSLIETKTNTLHWAARTYVIHALSLAKPPSPRTLKNLVRALSDPNFAIQEGAAQALEQFGVSSPEIVAGLKSLQQISSNNLVIISAAAAHWKLQKDATLVLPPVFKVLETQLAKPLPAYPRPGDSGQGVSDTDRLFMVAGELFRRMDLAEPDKTKALQLFEAWAKKSDRIFIQMQLLPAMADFGYPESKCLAVCKTGLARSEDYYRLQAARLLAQLGQKFPLNDLDLDSLIQGRDVGVRVYAAQIHWLRNHRSERIVPILIDALDRSKHQSYSYAETLPVALKFLAELGPEAREAAPALEKLTTDPNPDITKLATDALLAVRK